MKNTNPNDKKFDAFISFAEPNRELATDLHHLLAAAGLNSFIAFKNLPKDSPEDWQKGILEDGIMLSKYYVPIFTRESLKRPWVLFEAGAAAAQNLPFIVTHIAGIAKKEMDEFPYIRQSYYFKLFFKDDLNNLLCHIAGEKGKTEDFKQKVDQVFADRRKLVEEIMCLAHRRWVFIAGNLPNASAPEGISNPKQIRLFVRMLSEKLIEAGFNLSACPQVKSIGRVVLNTSQTWITEDQVCPVTGCKVDYEIAGIYPIDREPKLAKTTDPKVRTRWKDHLLEFRKSYLLNKDWVIIIGGNEGSLEEFEAVVNLNVEKSQGIKVCFIPCFGGSAMKLNARRKKFPHAILYYNGCEGWHKSQGLDRLVENVIRVIRDN